MSILNLFGMGGLGSMGHYCQVHGYACGGQCSAQSQQAEDLQRYMMGMQSRSGSEKKEEEKKPNKLLLLLR